MLDNAPVIVLLFSRISLVQIRISLFGEARAAYIACIHIILAPKCLGRRRRLRIAQRHVPGRPLCRVSEKRSAWRIASRSIFILASSG